ncbi:hypothetical protein EVJ58_g7853 [Rhodofomes roseus]|uniref:DUF1793-domain-containing protein n=1 Tax=Rhodofomes roseus TaxID=34475 RepID=A0A4Y9Y3T0_9APHY|nr:hypothetical protein EVJ58_g7853 [Rhodofomes roseus]
MKLLVFALLLVPFIARVHGVQTFWPAAIPYAVRTPYLNTWIGTAGSDSSKDWPVFWDGAVTGWILYIQVDGKTYTLFGNNNLPSNYSVTAGIVVETELTPTQTIQLRLQTSSAFQENTHQAEDGVAYFAMGLEPTRNITLQTCEDTVCREEFILAAGVNSNDNNSTNRAINSLWPVFPISVNLGSVSSVDQPIVWIIGYVRDPNINYTLSGNSASLRPYYTANFSTTESALEFFVSDFNNSLAAATALDADLHNAASTVSPDGKLYDMLSLATRQVFSSLEITAPYSSGQADDATRIFMKDLARTQRVTPVETLYAALPMLLYFNNASLVKPLLLPLLEQQNVSLSQYLCAAKDLGESFPEVNGPVLLSQEGIEQTGNMLIAALAHARYSQDTSLLHDYYALFKSWAQYLTTDNNALYPHDQTSIDDGSTSPNSTNLAVKGIFAIQAMAEISQLVGQTNDYQQFSLFDQLTVTYGQWIDSSFEGYKYGLPIESASTSPGNVAWNAFIAATVTNNTVRDQLLDSLWNYASSNATSTPFLVWYDVETGSCINGSMSALGGLFAPFLRSGTVAVSTSAPSKPASTSASSGGSGSHVDVGAIAGGVVGGVVGLLALLGLLVWFFRRRQSRKRPGFLDTSGTRTEPTPFEPSSAAPDVNMTEKRRRELQSPREGIPLLSVNGSSSATGDAEDVLPGGPGASLPSTTSDSSRPSRHDELLGLRSEIEDLRRIMLNVHIERPEPSDLGAPPVYS